MCHRMSPLLLRELQEGLRYMEATGRATVPRREPGTAVPDAYPGTQVPLFVPDGDGGLVATELFWGFEGLPSRGGAAPRRVFNTRIETALSQARTGRGMWARPISVGRCLVPVRAFYEWWTEPDPDAPVRADGSRARREVRYGLSGHRIFLMACVRDEGHFSVVTTAPNADVAPVHNRMPLVLAPGESRVWLGPDYATLADRGSVRLDSAVDGA